MFSQVRLLITSAQVENEVRYTTLLHWFNKKLKQCRQYDLRDFLKSLTYHLQLHTSRVVLVSSHSFVNISVLSSLDFFFFTFCVSSCFLSLSTFLLLSTLLQNVFFKLFILYWWLHEGRQINFHPRPSGVYQKHELLYSNDVEAPRNKAHQGRPGGSGGKASACNSGNLGSYPWVGKIPWRREWLPTPVFLPGEFHGQVSLAAYSPQGYK